MGDKEGKALYRQAIYSSLPQYDALDTNLVARYNRLRAFPRRTLNLTLGPIWDFPKIRVPYLGVLMIRILLFRVLYWGPLFSEPPYVACRRKRSVIPLSRPHCWPFASLPFGCLGVPSRNLQVPHKGFCKGLCYRV